MHRLSKEERIEDMRNQKWIFVGILMLMFALLGMTAQAQGITPTPANPNANVSWPPPVYVVRGQFTIRGSANLPNMTNYFIEFRPLNDDLTIPDEDALWTPATLPSSAAVQDDVLGVWNTLTAPDGVYELRLTINASGAATTHVLVSPLRVENTPPPFATPEGPITVPTFTPQVGLPTLQATPTAFDTNPRVTANRNANVRRGDSTAYQIIGSLNDGDTAPIVGISSFGTGWYLIQLPNGNQGWIAPSVVTVLGDLRNVPRVSPPPPPATATPTQPPTPISNINLVAGNFRFDPPSPKCNETFNVFMDVANFGNQQYFGGGFLAVQDFRRADNAFQLGNAGALPAIAPGQTINVGPISLKVPTYYNEEHRLVMTVDSTNQVFESNEGDNVKEAIYVLQKAGCP
jgi:hypothetical protein